MITLFRKYLIDDIIKTINVLMLIMIVLILALELPVFRSLIKSCIAWVFNVLMIDEPFTRYQINRFMLERIFVIIILFCVLLRIMMVIYYLFLRITASKLTKGSNGFKTSLLNYLNAPSCNKGFLIKGNWGSGKTYILDSFLKEYYNKPFRPIYRVSCFGLTDRSALIDEIAKVIRESDKSLYALSLSFLKVIPVIGEPLADILHKEYHYSSVRRDSIFIFDDFERVCAPRLPREKRNINGCDQSQYAWNNHELSEHDIILRDGVIQLAEMTSLIDNQRVSYNSDKYLSLVSIMSDMIEKQHLKVIIVCNTNYLGNAFVRDVLKSKLNCYEYNKTTSIDSAKEYTIDILKNMIIDDSRIRNLLEEFLGDLDVSFVLQFIQDDNLRSYGNLIEAFIATAQIFSERELSIEGYLASLFQSILVYYHCTKYKHRLNKNEVGENLIYMYKDKKVYSLKARWVGYNIAAYWFENCPYIKNVQEYVLRWQTYKYIDIEENLAQNNFSAFDNFEYDIQHLIYMFSRVKDSELSDIRWKKYIDDFISKCNLSEGEALHDLMRKLESSGYTLNSDVREVLYNKIAEYSGWRKEQSDMCVAYEYNDYIDRMQSNQ